MEKEFRAGVLYSIKRIAKKSKDHNISSDSLPVVQNVPEQGDCTDWYWVTTYYYADGTYEEVWEYLYTTCDNGGGGSGDNPPNNSYDVDYTTSSSEDNTSEPETPDGQAGDRAPRIDYYFDFTLQYVNDEVINVIRYPVRASPMISTFTNRGWMTTRTLSLLGQSNSWTPLSAVSGYISWSWFTHAHFSYVGSPTTRDMQWSKYHSEVN